MHAFEPEKEIGKDLAVNVALNDGVVRSYDYGLSDEAAVLADILKRDERDQNRPVAPLKPAKDAYLLDNSHLDIEGGVRAAIDIVEAVRAGRQRV